MTLNEEYIWDDELCRWWLSMRSTCEWGVNESCRSWLLDASMSHRIHDMCNDWCGWSQHYKRRGTLSMLQYVAVCCSVLQCGAVCCSVLQCVAMWCSVVQCAHRKITNSSKYQQVNHSSQRHQHKCKCIYAWDVQRFTYVKLACIRLNFLHCCVTFVGPLLNFEECLANRAFLEKSFTNRALLERGSS